VLSAGCGNLDQTGTEPIASQESALRAFGPWTPIGTVRFINGPVVVNSDSAGTTLVGINTDGEVYTTNDRDPGGLGARLNKISSFGTCTTCPGTPGIAAAGLTGESGSMANTMAIAFKSNADQKIYIRIQTLSGTVIHDWDPIPSPIAFDVPLGLAWLPRTSHSGSQERLLLVTTSPTDDRNYVYINGVSLANGVYNHADWGTFTKMALPGGKLFTQGITAVALAWACPPSSTDYSLVVASEEAPTAANFPQSQTFYARYNASSGGWSSWNLAQNLLTRGNIALAPGCSEFGHEMSLFAGSGVGTALRPYVTMQAGGGSTIWSAIGTDSPVFVRGAGLSSGRVFLTLKNDSTKVQSYTTALAP